MVVISNPNYFIPFPSLCKFMISVSHSTKAFSRNVIKFLKPARSDGLRFCTQLIHHVDKLSLGLWTQSSKEETREPLQATLTTHSLQGKHYSNNRSYRRSAAAHSHTSFIIGGS